MEQNTMASDSKVLTPLKKLTGKFVMTFAKLAEEEPRSWMWMHIRSYSTGLPTEAEQLFSYEFYPVKTLEIVILSPKRGLTILRSGIYEAVCHWQIITMTDLSRLQ